MTPTNGYLTVDEWSTRSTAVVGRRRMAIVCIGWRNARGGAKTTRNRRRTEITVLATFFKSGHIGNNHSIAPNDIRYSPSTPAVPNLGSPPEFGSQKLFWRVANSWFSHHNIELARSVNIFYFKIAFFKPNGHEKLNWKF